MNEDVISQLAYQEFVNTEQKKEIELLREALGEIINYKPPHCRGDACCQLEDMVDFMRDEAKTALEVKK